MKASPRLTIGRVAKIANVSVETIRYYERCGVISKPEKQRGSYREYSSDTIRRICFVKGAQELGFKLREIQELLSLRVKGHTTPDVIRTKVNLKLRQVEEKILQLNRIHKALLRINICCENQDPEKNCPVLESFYESEGANALGFIDGLQTTPAPK